MSDNIKIVPLFEKKGGKIVRLPDGTSKRRNYRFFVGTNGMFNMEMDAVLSEEIDRMIAAVPHAGRSGLRKLAYYAVKDMKKDAKRGGPSGENWPELNEVTRLFPGKSSLRTQDRRKRRTGVKATFGKLTRAIAYYRYPAPRVQGGIRLSVTGSLSAGGASPARRKIPGFAKNAPSVLQERLYRAERRHQDSRPQPHRPELPSAPEGADSAVRAGNETGFPEKG